MNRKSTGEDGWHNRGYLPHYDPEDTIQTVTFRLFDSLPQQILTSFKEEISNSKADRKSDFRTRKIKEMERWLDSGIGSCLLRDPRVALIIKEALFYFNHQRYSLDAWIIMPNHVHLILHVLPDHSLSSIIFSLKSYTAKQINRTLNRQGPVWFPDYFDRFIRSAEHFNTAKWYVENNPVIAGLCACAEEWRFSSAWKE